MTYNTQAYVNLPINYQFVISNSGPGPATGIQVYDTMPVNTGNSVNNGPGYSGPQWRFLSGSYSGEIACGPFSLGVGQSLTVQLSVLVSQNAASTSITDSATVIESAYDTSVSGSYPSNVAALGVVPSYTSTFTISPTYTVSPTTTRTFSITPTVSATATPTPGPNLNLVKSANRITVINFNDAVTYKLQLSNQGSYAATSVTVWDTLPFNFTPISYTSGAQVTAGVVSWTLANVAPAPAATPLPFFLWGNFSGAGTQLQNQASAQAGNQAAIVSNTNLIAVGGTFTNSPSPTISATFSPSPTFSATPTFAYSPPQLYVSIVELQPASNWPTSPPQDPSYQITFGSAACPTCATVNDVILTYKSDLNYGGGELDSFTGMGPSGTGDLAPPGAGLNAYYWEQLGFAKSTGMESGLFTLAPGNSNSRQVSARVQGLAVNTTITSEILLTEATYNISVSATVSTYIYAAQPPTPTITPTPIAQTGHTVAYPQPAKDTLCIAYFSPQGGPLSIDIYNLAFQRVAHITDSSQGGKLETACVGISTLAPGVYVYRTTVGGYVFPLARFGVMR